jgi:exodeoxyribonuclease VII large subunit
MSNRVVFTVSGLSQRIKMVLEEGVPAVWVRGEVSNLRMPGSGHAYFTLKDQTAQIRAVLFRGRGRRVHFDLEDGMQVLAFGGIDIYAARGEYQLVVDLLEPHGFGALQLAFEQLKRKLAAEGLFDGARKRPLPAFPRTIALVTSPTGAAIRDMLNVIGRRFGGLRILVVPVRVQGDEAPGDIVAALATLRAVSELDVVIVGRGGGSIEDLWAFNDERVARAIAACSVPVVSAVGHETDSTIADFVADLRAPTPSAAAELVVPDKLEVARRLAVLHERLLKAVRVLLADRRRGLNRVTSRRVLREPARGLRDHQRRLDDLAARLHAASDAHRRGLGHRLALAGNSLRSLHPLARISRNAAVLAQLENRLVSAAGNSLKTSRHRFAACMGRLDSLSPLAVLARGYSVTRLGSGAIVRSAGQTRPGDEVEILLHQGVLGARVTAVKDTNERHQV